MIDCLSDPCGRGYSLRRDSGRHPAAAALLLRLSALAAAQDDHAKQKAIDQTRRVAKSIKECAEQLTGNWQDECKVHKLYSGPPTNVEWDVVPSKTVRSPFQGIIEFTVPTRFQDTRLDGSVKEEPSGMRRKGSKDGSNWVPLP